MKNARTVLGASLLVLSLGSGCALWENNTTRGTLTCSCRGTNCTCSHCQGDGLECRCCATDPYPDSKVGPPDDK